MTKLYNCSFRKQEGKHFIDGYIFQKPLKEKFTPCLYSTFEEFLSAWEKTKQSIEVHKSQVEGVKEFLYKKHFPSPHLMDEYMVDEALEEGLSIPDENIYFKSLITEVKDDIPTLIQYAFLKQETKESDLAYTTANIDRNIIKSSVEEESQDELWLQLLGFIWQNNDRLPLKLERLKSKFTITNKESQDELLTECLETITKLRPNNAGLGVLQHKLKVRLNKF